MNSPYLLAILTAVFLLPSPAHGQAQHSANIGINLNAGTKSFPLHGRFGKGLSVEYVNTLSPRVGLRASLGYEHFSRRFPGVDPMTRADSIAHMDIRGYDLAFVPLRAGLQHHIGPSGPFVYGELGAAYVISGYTRANIPDLAFTFATGLGYQWKFSRSKQLQFSIAYNYYQLNKYYTRDYIGFRMAYGITK